ncbi:MAG: O-acetyl-ADP-ribose deacetylase [Myxococcota bacterium]
MKRYKNGRVVIQQGDITRLGVDAIVNAANTALRGGGGVDGAIHRVAGPELMHACAEIGGCDTGQAVVTPGFGLPAKYVIHTVGPAWQDGNHHEDELLASCYEQSLRRALENDCTTVAFPAISTGRFRFPKERAAQTAVATVLDFLDQHPGIEQVVFCCYSDADLAIYESVADEYL